MFVKICLFIVCSRSKKIVTTNTNQELACARYANGQCVIFACVKDCLLYTDTVYYFNCKSNQMLIGVYFLYVYVELFSFSSKYYHCFIAEVAYLIEQWQN